MRFATLGVQSLDHDEAVTAMRVLQPGLGGTLTAVLHVERTPPLYYVLAWVFAKPLGLGMGQLDLRALSAIFGTLTVPVAYLAGRELASRRAGLIAAALVALNPFLVWYSQEARAYALLVLLSALGLYLFARAMRNPSRLNLALWALASMLALCTHYFAVFAIVPEGIWLIAAVRPRRRALGAVAATGAVGAALLPLAALQEGSGHPNGFTAIPVLDRAWQALVHFSSSVEPVILSTSPGFATVQISAGVGELLLAFAAVTILWRRGARVERRGALRAASVGVAALAIPVGLALGGVDYLDSRNVIAVVVPLLVAVAVALGARRAGRAGLVAAAGTCAFFACVLVAVNALPQMQRTDWRGVAHAIGPTLTRRVVVAPRAARYPLLYYLHGTQFEHGDPPVLTRRLDLITNTSAVTPPGSGFRHPAVRALPGGLWLWRYVARRPQLIRPLSVHRGRLVHQPAAGILTGPAAPISGARLVRKPQPTTNAPPGHGAPA